MGKTTNYLLVNLLLSGLLTVSFPCFAQVKAEQYDAFWLWSGVKAQPVLNKANTLYLLKGQIVSNYNNQTYFINQGNGVIKSQPQYLWLVYRTHTLAWTEDIYNTLIKQLTNWQQAGIAITGIQIDFDSATGQLDAYLTFLTTLRTKLPKQYKLSITGLLDWGKNADIATLNKFSGIADELVIQTYQGQKTITNYQQYLPPLTKLTIPFKIGLVQYGEWQAPKNLTTNPYFKGYVIFLQNPINRPD